MKKTSKLVTALILSIQVLSTLPSQSLANEIQKTPIVTDQVATSSDKTSSTSTQLSSTTTRSTETSSESAISSTTTSKTSSKMTETTTASSQVQPTTPSQEQSRSVQQTEPESTVPVVQTAPYSSLLEEGNQEKTTINDTGDDAIHFEKDGSVESFIRKVGESARKIGQEKGVYASVMIAQAILESASGQSALAQAPNYNLFGIKGEHNGKTISMATQEDAGNGALYTIQANFRVYENYEDCFSDYATLLKEGISGNSQFYSGTWKEHAKTYQEATKYLTGRYATDMYYDLKLNGLIQAYELTQYDGKVQNVPSNIKGYQVPVDHYTISNLFGFHDGEFHRGVDLAASQGEPIHASKSGAVIKAEYHPSWGNYVVIEHSDGTTALYAHQQQYIIKVGDKVEQGQTIGYVGSTGNSTGPHLHIELCKDSSLSQTQLIDPQSILFGK